MYLSIIGRRTDHDIPDGCSASPDFVTTGNTGVAMSTGAVIPAYCSIRRAICKLNPKFIILNWKLRKLLKVDMNRQTCPIFALMSGFNCQQQLCTTSTIHGGASDANDILYPFVTCINLTFRHFRKMQVQN